MTTIKDIARECGVSANTVSCVLNNKAGEVSAQTRERVLAEIRRLGYRPNAAARRMGGKRTHTIGIADQYITNTKTDPYRVHLLEPIVHAAREHNWDLLYYSGHVDHVGFTSFLDGRSDGLICLSGGIGKDEVAAFLQTDLPIVLIGTAQDDQTERQNGGIDVDNEKGAHIAVSHLTNLGHRRIAMLQGERISGNSQRVAGYERALCESGVQFDERLVLSTMAWDELAYKRTVELLSWPAHERPTAIFCFNDVLATAALQAAKDKGVRVPDELSVVGFDDITLSALTDPPLTTVRQPLEWIGRRAVEILIEIMEGKLPKDYHEVVEPTLVVRSSTAPPATSPPI